MKKLISPRKLAGVSLLTVSVLLALWLIGQIARDATWLSGLCFYIPSPLLVMLLVLTACVQFRLGNRLRSRAVWVAATLPLFFVVFIENSFSLPAVQERKTINERAENATSGAKKTRLVHWNVCRGGLGWESIQEELANRAADIYIVSEVPAIHDALAPLLERLGEEFSAVRFSSLAVIARGELSYESRLANYGPMRTFPVSWQFAGQSLTLIVVDIDSKVTLSRDPLLRGLNEIIKSQRPDLVIGDLNAPRRSLALDDLPSGFRHAYHSAGAGWGYTWPVPLPMYSLDHCIHGPRVLPVKYELDTSVLSDHRMQVFEFRIE